MTEGLELADHVAGPAGRVDEALVQSEPRSRYGIRVVDHVPGRSLGTGDGGEGLCAAAA